MLYFYIIIAGFGGGAVRGLIGFMKHQYSYKNVGFNIPYFLAMAFLSGIVGLLVSAAMLQTGMDFIISESFTPAISFIVGYAGGDFLENIYKLLIKKKSS
ncbi:MAG: hypothetical protein PHI53_02325 [Candidatus Pacebacteria bacterium]|nr:hypothetical protein [Candidatus Paceibacterota bacterium]